MTQAYHALSTQLQTVEGLPPLAPLNKTFKPSATQRWVRATLLPSESESGAIGSDGYLIQQGLFQIDLFTPVGLGDDYELANSIRAAFPERGEAIAVGDYRLRVTASWIEAARQEPTFLVTTVMVRWQMPEKGVT